MTQRPSDPDQYPERRRWIWPVRASPSIDLKRRALLLSELLAEGVAARDGRMTYHMVYHMVMGRREVLVQLDDELVERLDRLADEQGTNRSELLRRGAAAVLEAAELAAADRELQDAYRRIPQDPAVVTAATRLAAQTVPEW